MKNIKLSLIAPLLLSLTITNAGYSSNKKPWFVPTCIARLLGIKSEAESISPQALLESLKPDITSYTITDNVITECNGFPLHMPLDPEERVSGILAGKETVKKEMFENKDDFIARLKSLHQLYKGQPEQWLNSLTPLLLSDFMCAENKKVADALKPMAGETSAPAELQLLWKQIQIEIGTPQERHVPLKFSPSLEGQQTATCSAMPGCVHIHNLPMNLLSHTKLNKNLMSYTYGYLRSILSHEAIHLFYNDGSFNRLFVPKNMIPQVVYCQEHRADRQGLNATQCHACVMSLITNHDSSAYLNFTEQDIQNSQKVAANYTDIVEKATLVARFKTENKVCPVHKRLAEKAA